MVNYKSVKVIIDAPGLTEVILDMIIHYHNFYNSIVSNWGSVFTSKYCSLIYEFSEIKQKLSSTSHPQTESLSLSICH